MSILLSSILPIPNPEQYKAHLACWNQRNQPLDVFVRSKDQWHKWNEWRSTKNDFNRDFIFSLIDFYPDAETGCLVVYIEFSLAAT